MYIAMYPYENYFIHNVLQAKAQVYIAMYPNDMYIFMWNDVFGI